MRPLQESIIRELKVKAQIDPGEEVRRSVDFLKRYLLQHPFLKTLVLGISGGQDSTLAGKLSQMAIEELRLESGQEAYQFIAVRLPYGRQNDEDDAQKALDFIQADQVYTVNIQASTDAMTDALKAAGIELTDYHKGNVKARDRMIAQYAIAGQMAGAVVGSDHAAESVTGFYTKFGDGAADVMPLWRLNKRQGRELLKYLNCPADLYLKVPVADLEDDRPMIADEDVLGVSYEAIDDYLEGKEVSDQEAETIERWYMSSRHKRHLPINVYDTFWQK